MNIVEEPTNCVAETGNGGGILVWTATKEADRGGVEAADRVVGDMIIEAQFCFRAGGLFVTAGFAEHCA